LTKSQLTRGKTATNDNSGASEPKAPSTNLPDAILMGLRFYSRLPTGDTPHKTFDFKAMVRPLPFASLIIGVAPAFVLLMLSVLGTPALFAATIGVALMAIVTGAMAEDAFGDAMDGLFGGQTLERKLEIMHDSRHGTYGVLGIVAPFVLRVACLSALVAASPLAAAAIWLATTVLARSGATWIAVTLPPARADGLSASAGTLPAVAFYIGMGLALAISFVLIVPFSNIGNWILAVGFGAAVLILWRQFLQKMLGGQTGDTIGAAQLLLEIAILSSFMFGVGQ